MAVFNLQGSELLIIGVLALVVLGPEKLPDAARRIGRIIAQIRQMGDGFVEEFRKAVDEPIVELRRTVQDTAAVIEGTSGDDREERPRPPSDAGTSQPTDGAPS